MSNEQIAKIGYSPVYDNGQAIFFTAGLTVDADGSPRAYGPNGKGLDYLGNAGDIKKGKWWGVAVDENNKPYVQGPNDPAPGYYVSTTSLQDTKLEARNPRRYIDSEQIPFIVLPPQRKDWGVKMGDYATVVHLASGRYAHAILADTGPPDHLGETSIRTADMLRIESSPKTGGAASGIFYIVYPKSGDGKPKSAEQIKSSGQVLFDALGAMDFVNKVRNEEGVSIG